MHTKCSFISRAICGVLEALVLHHVAPVAGRVADRQKNRLVLGLRPLERLGPPRIPVDRIVGVLQQIGTGLGGRRLGMSS